MDQKYVAYNALLCETDTSLIKNQRTTFVVFVQSASVRPYRYAPGNNHSSSIDIQGAKNLVVVRAEFLFDDKFLEHFWHRPIPLLLSSTHRRNEFQQCPFLKEQCIYSAFFPSLKKSAVES